MKVHKSPLKTRPIVSCFGSLLYGIGVWVDDKLQNIACRQKTYFKSSYDLKKELINMHLPSSAHLFTSDAFSMYTDINTDPVLQEIVHYLCTDIPVPALLAALTLVMKNNVIQFGDTHWIQLQGAVMGSPPALPFATLFYTIFEETLLAEFSSNILLLHRFIDDIFGIWVPTEPACDDLNNWNTFKARLSDFLHGLQLEFSERTTSVVLPILCATTVLPPTWNISNSRMAILVLVCGHSSHDSIL
jgi:hypothetical protein